MFGFMCRTSFQLSKLESTICNARNLCYRFRNALAVSRFCNNILAVGPVDFYWMLAFVDLCHCANLAVKNNFRSEPQIIVITRKLFLNER